MIDQKSTLEDICFVVSTALDRHRITAVLTGGSAATVYAAGAYTSMDADFVLTNYPARSALESAMTDVGYVPSQTAGMYEHPNSVFTVDFPKGPLAVGGDYIHETTILGICRGNARVLGDDGEQGRNRRRKSLIKLLKRPALV